MPISYDHVDWTTGGNFDGYMNASSCGIRCCG
jgi:hypothetical protein